MNAGGAVYATLGYYLLLTILLAFIGNRLLNRVFLPLFDRARSKRHVHTAIKANTKHTLDKSFQVARSVDAMLDVVEKQMVQSLKEKSSDESR